jgi:hypothetical protein
VLLLIFLAHQEDAAGMSDKESSMTLSMCQSWIMEGAYKTVIITKESPFMMNFLSCIETAREAASRAARANLRTSFDDGACVIPANCYLS